MNVQNRAYQMYIFSCYSSRRALSCQKFSYKVSPCQEVFPCRVYLPRKFPQTFPFPSWHERKDVQLTFL